MKRSFCVLILSNGRAGNVKTLDTLKAYGYKGDWFILVDDEDPQGPEYSKLYGEHVLTFCKEDAAKITDSRINTAERRSPVFARNASFEIMRDLGYETFVQLDDDYATFLHRIVAGDQYSTSGQRAYLLDEVFESICDLLYDAGFASVAFAQGGDFIGGKDSIKKYRRKAMNSFFLRSDKPFRFEGILNDDVSTYVSLGRRGQLFLTIPHMQINQEATQKQAGGITELYRDSGTYLKSMQTVLGDPSSTKVACMGRSERRIHHRIDWELAVPKIVPESCRKV